MNPLLQSRRAALVVLLVGLALAPLIGIGVVRAVRSNANDVRDWLPAHYTETVQYRWFHANFGSEDFVVLSWPGCTLSDERLDQVADKLRGRSEAHAAAAGEALFRRVTTGRELVKQMTTKPASLDRGLVISRLVGTIVGPDRDVVTGLLFPARGVVEAADLRTRFQDLLETFADAHPASSMHLARAIVVDRPPSFEAGEITDKGSLNQKAVMVHRPQDVDELYEFPLSARVLALGVQA